GESAARTAERRVHLQEPARRSRGSPDRGRGSEGLAGGRGSLLGAARQLHRERRQRASYGCAGTDGYRPAGGVGAEWGMAGARGAARRQLVGRSVRRRNRQRRPWTLPRVPWRGPAALLVLAGLAVVVAPPLRAGGGRPVFGRRHGVIPHHR